MSVWEEDRSLIVGEHGCYFCNPELYPAMMRDHTLCARCGVLMYIPLRDPMNECLFVCGRCEIELGDDHESTLERRRHGEQS